MYRNVDLQVWLVTRPVSLVHPMVQLHTSLLFNTFTISSFVSFTIFSSTSFTIFSSITFTIFRGFVAAEKQKKKEDKDREARNCRLPPHHTLQISQICKVQIYKSQIRIKQIGLNSKQCIAYQGFKPFIVLWFLSAMCILSWVLCAFGITCFLTSHPQPTKLSWIVVTW